ncbi:MAG: type II CAAX endopeptidase family protein [Candidatus Acidiferrales bacterium]
MADEHSSEPKRDLQGEPAGGGGAEDPLNAGGARQTQRWGRTDRNRLFIWLGIGLISPGILIYALRVPLKLSGTGFTARSELLVKGIAAFMVVLATWIVARIEKRPLDDYGMPLRQALGWRFWEGLAWGFAMLSAILLILHATGHFQIDSMALAGGAIYRYALEWGVAFLFVAINEEFAFRGYLLFTFSRRLRFWPAAIFVSAIFGAAHLGNPGENVFGILQVVVIGLLFCLMIRRTGTLWFALGFHAAWDWAETYFYGTPDSGLLGDGRLLNTSAQGPKWLTGGSAGPEGSVIAFLVLILCALLIHLRFPKAVYPDRPV